MFTFFTIIFTNILIGSILYLVISLKLEKTSSAFFSRKLKREMDEIISEFNETAERNISILENRISIYKKLMAKDFLPGFDETVDVSSDGQSLRTTKSKINAVKPDASVISGTVKKINAVTSAYGKTRKESSVFDVKSDQRVQMPSGGDDFPDDPDINKAFKSADDKPLFVFRLYSNGWSEDEIVRQCGISSGELKLMLNLSGEL